MLKKQAEVPRQRWWRRMLHGTESKCKGWRLEKAEHMHAQRGK
jgi:hypothetical protein